MWTYPGSSFLCDLGLTRVHQVLILLWAFSPFCYKYEAVFSKCWNKKLGMKLYRLCCQTFFILMFNMMVGVLWIFLRSKGIYNGKQFTVHHKHYNPIWCTVIMYNKELLSLKKLLKGIFLKEKLHIIILSLIWNE